MSTDAATRASGSNRPIDPRLLRYSSASRHFLLITAAIVLAQTGVIIGFAWLLTTALVGAIAGEPVETLLPALGGAAALALVRGLLIAASERTSALGAARASLQLRAALVSAVDRLGPGWLSRRNSAALAVTAGHGLEALDAYFGRYLPQLVATAITMPVLIVTILVSDPLSGLIVVLTMPLIPLFMVLIGLATQTVQRRQYGTLQHLASRFADTVAGLGTLKVFGRQHRAARSIETVTGDYKRETMAVLRVSFLSGFALEFLASISVAIIAVEIGFRLLGGQMPLLVGLFVLLLAPEAYLPLRQVGVQFHAAAEGVAATDEIFQTLDDARALTSAASVAPAPATPPTTAGPLLRLDDLRVPRGDREIGPIDLELSAGEVVLLEGPSGAGKSSILAALLGFAEYTGRIEVAGSRATDTAARGILAWAGQRPGLVSGSVAENVALGGEHPDEALVARCLADAVADVDGALSLGVAGAGLSGGQAQRVAVARALYRMRRRGTPVLALDEPTSALDARTEAALWQTVRRAAQTEGAAVLLVSHRPTARTIADRVVAVSSTAAFGSAVDAIGEGGAS
ncbi:thiol reductant ABC exporter subunit CydD [Microbacterium binotii]|uniref:thiol reductant ABC exporter subunit CydD n=1 Tax=Microbacterium binotii TaxID=462710 RepID=UPI001F39A445|nr:thiol reductant ABC exporter subunit CydD [Microbacterium binotii]UIN31434.1 thiol reductant ABC exporter subunit CydD [Microbacterium binotii]